MGEKEGEGRKLLLSTENFVLESDIVNGLFDFWGRFKDEYAIVETIPMKEYLCSRGGLRTYLTWLQSRVFNDPPKKGEGSASEGDTDGGSVEGDGSASEGDTDGGSVEGDGIVWEKETIPDSQSEQGTHMLKSLRRTLLHTLYKYLVIILLYK
jgi:hypothetical protein